MNYKKLCIIAVLFISFFAVGSQAEAAADLKGWAWSSNIGHISFSSINSGVGSSSPYNVTLSTTTGSSVGNFGGYAWSSSVGWISFNPSDVAGCPADAMATAIDGCNPAVDLTTGKVTGWIRMLQAETPTESWLHLSGTNHDTLNFSGNGGVTFATSTGKFYGFSWGSDNVGWLSFNPYCNPNCGGRPLVVDPPVIVTCDNAPVPINVNVGDQVIYEIKAVTTPNSSFSFDGGATWQASNQKLLYNAVTQAQIDSLKADVYGVNGIRPVARVKDANGLYSITKPCDFRVRARTGDESAGIQMWIVPKTGTDTQTLSKIKVKVGGTLNIKMLGHLGNYTDCEGFFDSKKLVGADAIVTDVSSGASVAYSTASSSLLTLTNNTPHRFSMQCRDSAFNNVAGKVYNSDGTATAKATLDIDVVSSDSTIEEI